MSMHMTSVNSVSSSSSLVSLTRATDLYYVRAKFSYLHIMDCKVMSWTDKHGGFPDCFLVQFVRTRTIHHNCLRFFSWRRCHIVYVSFAGNSRESDVYLLRFVVVCSSISEAN